MNEKIFEALDIIDDGLLIVDTDYTIVYANIPARKLLRKENLVGMHSFEAIWDRKTSEGKYPSFISFDTHEVASAEKTFSDGTCLFVKSYPLDDEHLVLTIWDVTDYVSLERRLEKNSGTDPVTNLKNGTFFREDLEKELDREKRTNSNMALMLLEINDIEVDTEDEYEELLRFVAEIIVDTARSYDIPYRLHGDTFAVQMPHCSPDGAKKTGDRVLEKILSKYNNLNISVGIGSSESAFTGRDVVRLAERALYVAKHRGGNDSVIG